MDLEDKWFYKEYTNREEEVCHRAYEEELYFYQAITKGDVEYIDAICSQERFQEIPGIGVLSHNPLRDVQYHFVISTALTARACVEGGFPLEEAFSLSDFYIQQLEFCRTTLEIDQLNYKMCMDFTKRMQLQLKRNIYSKPINKCVNYIYSHLHCKIRVSELAEYVRLNKSHLSRLFKLETGHTIQEYITLQKLQEAKNMLKYSEFTCNEIAHNLAFSSQSHFSDIFKAYTDMTPKAYRELHYGKNSTTAVR